MTNEAEKDFTYVELARLQFSGGSDLVFNMAEHPFRAPAMRIHKVRPGCEQFVTTIPGRYVDDVVPAFIAWRARVRAAKRAARKRILAEQDLSPTNCSDIVDVDSFELSSRKVMRVSMATKNGRLTTAGISSCFLKGSGEVRDSSSIFAVEHLDRLIAALEEIRRRRDEEQAP